MSGPTRRQVLAAASAVGVAGGPGIRSASADTGAPPPAGNWSMSRRDARNSGYAPDATLPGSLGEAWTFEMADRRGSPVVVDGTVYASAFTEGMVAVDAATGSRVWHGLADLPGTVATTPAVADVSTGGSSDSSAGGTVYAGGSDYLALAVDATTGELSWTVEGNLGVDSATAPTVVDGTVYAAHDGGQLFAVDAATGDERWTVDVVESYQQGPPAVADGIVYFASGGTQYALDATTGDERWTNVPDSHPASGFVVGDGRCYFLTQDELVAIDAGTTERLWSYPVPGITFDPPTLVDGSVIVKGVSHLSRLDAPDGSVQWTFRGDARAADREEWTEMDVDLQLRGSVAGADGTLYVLARDDSTALLELDAATGEVLNRYTVGGDDVAVSSPVIAGGSLYFVTSEDELVAVRAEDAPGAAPTPTSLGQGGDDSAPSGENAPPPGWLDGWSTLLAWLVGVPVVGSVVLAVLVVAVDRYGDERDVNGDDGS